MNRIILQHILTLTFALSMPLFARDPGISAFYEGDFEKAKEYYQKRLDKDPENPKILYNYGTSALGLNDLESAAALLRRSLSSDNIKQRADAHYNLGQTALKNGDMQNALEHFKKSMIYDPGDKDSKVMFEQLLAMMKENERQQEQDKQGQSPSESGQNEEAGQEKERQENQSGEEQQSSQAEEQEPKEPDQPADSGLKEEDLNPVELSREQAENILNAMREEEMESMKKLILSKSNLKRTKRSKEW